MLIVDKPMPKNCCDCALDCCWVAGTMPFEYAEKRKPNCPIKGELVRCYKCVYWNRETIRWDGKQNIAVCDKCDEWKGADFYCADGERKEKDK